MYTSQLESTTLPFVIRYPRGEGVLSNWKKPFEEIVIGKGRKLRDGNDVAVLSFGHPGNFAASAIRDLKADGITPAHYDMRFAKPLDEDLLRDALDKYDRIVTVEDGTVIGGFGSAVSEFMTQHGYKNDLKILGIPDRVVEHGTLKELHNECGYNAEAIADAIREMMKEKIGLLY
jgi:1-deoxy-D-xylulose-5-phosphate synthase